MNNVVPIQQSAVADFSGKQLELIRKTVASDTNNDEFNLFIEVARRMGLDPFRRQIMPLVFSKDDPKKRRMSLITGIDGFRVIASRCADYRPDEREPIITYDESLKGSENPLGILKASVTAFKQDRAGAWHPVNGVAYWDEYVPLKEDADAFTWEDTGEVWPDSGKPKKKKVRKPGFEGNRAPEGQWGKMGRVMICKCAEAQALRKGWPESFSGLYDPAELDRAKAMDATASEIVEREAEDRRQLLIGGGRDNLIVDWLDDKELDRVPVGRFADRVMEYVGKHTPAEAITFKDRNRETFRDFWAKSPNDANELKKVFEKLERSGAPVIDGTVIDTGIPEHVAVASRMLTSILATETGPELDALLTSDEFKADRTKLPAKEWDRLALAGSKHRTEITGGILAAG